ncbi:MAG: UPF0146 family protein [Candidatus Hydrothermarchaeales archaeon]
MMADDYKDFVEFVIKNYRYAKKIIEVGVGQRSEVLKELDKALDAQVIGTDIKADDPKIVIDDITKPKLEIYTGADLIYSLRLPIELHPFVEEVAKRVGSDLIIKPLSTEYVNHKSLFKEVKLVNYKDVFFYLFR